MKLFHLTSSKFNGIAELLYNEAGVLCKIDCTGTDMNAETITHFKKCVASKVEEVSAGFTSSVTIVQADYAITFEMFYKDYPLKRNRYKAEQFWEKLQITDQIIAFSSLKGYKKYLAKNSNYLNPMIADRYLRSKEYLTEWNKL
jgi:hypothetical protein